MAGDFDGVALRDAREAAGLTQAELGRRIGVAGGDRVSRWELGRSTPQAKPLRALASELGVAVTDLLKPPSASGPDLRRLRREAAMSAGELATKINVTLPTLKRWEAAGVARAPTRKTIEAIALALDASTDDVMAAFRRSTGAGQPS